jgi:hypothetical protein
MRKAVAAIVVASLIVALAVPGASAATTAVNVRIEGKSETLFEGPILAEPHGVRAASDPIAPKIRRCDGTNPLNPAGVGFPAPTPTAVSADGMSLVGETFDGKWYDDLEDYFLTRWGPDTQNVGAAAYWGILVNNGFTNVGGCQYPLDASDEVLWIYDAFKSRPTLALFPESPHYDSGPRPLTATAMLNQPFPVEVVSYVDDLENKPPATPTRLGSSGFLGAEVAPVITSSKGFQRVDTASGATVTTDSAGKASVTFTTLGWQRIKATVGNAGAESAVRSNRLDVCVPGGGGAALEGAVGCGELPAADQARTPAPTVGEIEGPRRKPPAPQPGGGQGNPPPPGVAGSIHLTTPSLKRGRIGRGQLGVSWQVLDPGPGIRGWLISSRTLGRKGARYVSRASGASGTSATVRLPGGHSYRLRFTITDLLGRGSTVELGKVTIPDARRR